MAVAVAAMLVVGRGSTMAMVEEAVTVAVEEATMGGHHSLDDMVTVRP